LSRRGLSAPSHGVRDFGGAPPIRDHAERDAGNAKSHQAAGDALERFDFRGKRGQTEQQAKAERQ